MLTAFTKQHKQRTQHSPPTIIILIIISSDFLETNASAPNFFPFFPHVADPGCVDVEWIENGWIPGSTRGEGCGAGMEIVSHCPQVGYPFFHRYPPVTAKRCCPLTSKRPTRFSIGGDQRSNCDDSPCGPDDKPPQGKSTCARPNVQPRPNPARRTNFLLWTKKICFGRPSFALSIFHFSY